MLSPPPGTQVDLIEQKAIYFEGDKGEVTRVAEIPDDLKQAAVERREKLIEAVADVDEEIAELFLMEEDPDVQTLKVGALTLPRRCTRVRGVPGEAVDALLCHADFSSLPSVPHARAGRRGCSCSWPKPSSVVVGGPHLCSRSACARTLRRMPSGGR